MGKRGGTSGIGGSGSNKKERDSESAKEKDYIIIGVGADGKRIPIRIRARSKETAYIKAREQARQKGLKGLLQKTLETEEDFRKKYAKK